MSDRPGWRVANGRWVLGKSDEPLLAVTSDGQMQVDWPELGVWVRLNRAEARTLAALLSAYAETGEVPMDGAVPKTEADRLRAWLNEHDPGLLYAYDTQNLGMEARAMAWLCERGWTVVQAFAADGHRVWQVWQGESSSSRVSDAELVALAELAGWTDDDRPNVAAEDHGEGEG